MNAPAKAYLTPNEVAERLMVAPGTVRVWAEKGLLRAQTTVGGHRRFPVEEVERFLHERRLSKESAAPQALRVLIVEDDAALTRYLRAWLRGLGVEVEAAPDGFAAGLMLHAFRPHVMLLDLLMPGLDGFEVCRRVKADPATESVKVIAITGEPSGQNVARILEAGAVQCLAKPLDEECLAAALGLSLETLHTSE